MASYGGLPTIQLSHHGSTVDMTLHGAHVTHWRTASGACPLYLSPKAVFSPDKAIRGGVPVCWPQFSDMGPLPTAHGFARIDNRWAKDEARSDDSAVVLQLDVADQGVLRYRVEITGPESIALTLSFTNTSAQPQSFTAALHTYLSIHSIHHTQVSGALDRCAYADNLQNRQVFDAAPIHHVDREIDRIYFGTNGGAVEIRSARSEAEAKRQGDGDGATAVQVTTVTARGFPDTVFWNPWIEKTKKMSDLPSDAYLNFVCVESAAIKDRVVVDPGATWDATQIIAVGNGRTH